MRVLLLSSLLQPTAQALGFETVVLNDNLLVGPSATDSVEHARRRKQYWGEPPATFNPLASVSPEVWAQRDLRSTVQLWQIAHAMSRSGQPLRLRMFGESVEPTINGADFAAPAPRISPTLSIDDLPPLGEWTPSSMVEWADLWTAYTSTSPQTFNVASQRVSSPEVDAIRTYYSGFFPEQRDGEAMISRFDELLHGLIDDSWATPAAIFVRGLQARSNLASWIEQAGDSIISRRLFEWSSTTSAQILRRQEHEDTEVRPMTAFAFRLAAGALPSRLKDLACPAPELAIGGAVAYSSPPSWMVRRNLGAPGLFDFIR